MKKSRAPEVPINSEEEAALREFVRELVRKELEGLDEHIDKRIDAALRHCVLALRPALRNMEYK